MVIGRILNPSSVRSLFQMATRKPGATTSGGGGGGFKRLFSQMPETESSAYAQESQMPPKNGSIIFTNGEPVLTGLSYSFVVFSVILVAKGVAKGVKGVYNHLVKES